MQGIPPAQGKADNKQRSCKTVHLGFEFSIQDRCKALSLQDRCSAVVEQTGMMVWPEYGVGEGA